MSTHQSHPQHSHLHSHTHHHPKRKLKPHHHAIRIGSLLGVLFILLFAFASARTNFFNLFEKKVNDQTLTGMVAESWPCEMDATGNCVPENQAEPCVMDATGGCIPEAQERPRPEQEDCVMDETGGCFPSPRGQPEPSGCAEPDETGGCPEPKEEDCVKDANGRCVPEEQRQPAPEECPNPDVTGKCPEPVQRIPSEDCLNVDVTGKCIPENQDPIDPEEEPIPTSRTQTPAPTDFTPATRVQMEPEVYDTPVAFSESGENTEVEGEETEMVVQPPPPVLQPVLQPQIKTETQINTQTHTEAYTPLLDVPTKYCLYYDPDRPLTLIDINPENKAVDQLTSLRDRAIVVLSKTYVKNPDGTKTYIIDGNPIDEKNSAIRVFAPDQNIIRRDAGKLEMLIHCLDIKSVDFLKRADQTVSGKPMPNFNDLPKAQIRSFNDAIVYSTAFYDIITGTLYGQRVHADAQRDILAGEAVKTLVRTRQMILGQPLTQDAHNGAWYSTFFDAALDEGLGVEDLRASGNQPLTRGRFAQELLELALMRNMYNNQEEVEAFLGGGW